MDSRICTPSIPLYVRTGLRVPAAHAKWLLANNLYLQGACLYPLGTMGVGLLGYRYGTTVLDFAYVSSKKAYAGNSAGCIARTAHCFCSSHVDANAGSTGLGAPLTVSPGCVEGRGFAVHDDLPHTRPMPFTGPNTPAWLLESVYFVIRPPVLMLRKGLHKLVCLVSAHTWQGCTNVCVMAGTGGPPGMHACKQ